MHRGNTKERQRKDKGKTKGKCILGPPESAAVGSNGVEAVAGGSNGVESAAVGSKVRWYWFLPKNTTFARRIVRFELLAVGC